MNLAALSVVNSFNEIFLAYGQSDEYSFVFRREANIYNRRAEKILTCIIQIKNLIINYILINRYRLLFYFIICLQLE